MHTLGDLFQNYSEMDVNRTELFSTFLAISDYCQEREIHEWILGVCLAEKTPHRDAALNICKECTILGLVSDKSTVIKTHLELYLNSNKPSEKCQAWRAVLYLLESPLNESLASIIKQIVLPVLESSWKIHNKSYLQTGLELSVFLILCIKWSSVIPPRTIGAGLAYYRNSKNDLVNVGLSKLIQYESLEVRELREITQGLSNCEELTASWSWSFISALNGLEIFKKRELSNHILAPEVVGYFSVLFELTLGGNIINPIGLKTIESLTRVTIKVNHDSAETLLNKILWEIVNSNDLRHSLKLYPTLKIVIDTCDPDLVVEWILLSLSNILSRRPLWTAICLSTLLYMSLNKDQPVCISDYLHEYLAFCQESRDFIKEELGTFKRVFITDELQRCGLDSAYKRALSGYEEKKINPESDYCNISESLEFEFLNQLYYDIVAIPNT